VKSRFHPGAQSDLAEDVEYYDLAAPGLGDRLLAEVRAAVGFLEAFPFGAPSVADEIRGKVLVRFPHTLLYVIEENEVVILGVAHQRQDLQAWLQIVRARRAGQ
jgi:plasmid stabilization system protein ParE